MNRDDFHKLFKCVGPAVLPVIHVRDARQARRNVAMALAEGAQGAFLINHDFDMDTLLPILAEARRAFPRAWLGVNFLAISGLQAFPALGRLAGEGIALDAYWADDARIDERAGTDGQREAHAIGVARAESGWNGLYFGGTAFKKQREVEPGYYARAAELAAGFMDAVTTSGPATGQEADPAKIDAFRRGAGDTPLAVASGITPANAGHYCEHVDAFLVATGVNRPGDFYDIEPVRLRRLLAATRRAAAVEVAREDRDAGWYLSRMSPNTKGEAFAWLDPSSMYVDGGSFHALLDALLAPFDPADIDVVAGPDAMGFVLGAAMATRLGKGFLTVRKAGKIPVDTDSVSFTNYTGREQRMEMRMPAFASGTRVLLVDQWIETGGTMNGAVELVQRQGGVVAGIAAVCIEENPRTDALRERFVCSSAVVPGSALQAQCNRQTLASFDTYTPSCTFPEQARRR